MDESFFFIQLIYFAIIYGYLFKRTKCYSYNIFNKYYLSDEQMFAPSTILFQRLSQFINTAAKYQI